MKTNQNEIDNQDKKNIYVSIDKLTIKDKFLFQGDVLKEHYYFAGLRHPYAKVVYKQEDIGKPEKWSLVSRNSIVMKIND